MLMKLLLKLSEYVKWNLIHLNIPLNFYEIIYFAHLANKNWHNQILQKDIYMYVT